MGRRSIDYDWTPERIDRVFECRRNGMTFSAIAREFGISKGAVAGMIDRQREARGMPPPKKLIRWNGSRLVADTNKDPIKVGARVLLRGGHVGTVIDRALNGVQYQVQFDDGRHGIFHRNVLDQQSTNNG